MHYEWMEWDCFAELLGIHVVPPTNDIGVRVIPCLTRNPLKGLQKTKKGIAGQARNDAVKNLIIQLM